MSYFDFEDCIRKIDEDINALKDSEDSKNKSVLKDLEAERLNTLQAIYSNLSPWNVVSVARHNKRPTVHQYINELCDDFIDINGDRSGVECDSAMVCGIARIGGYSCVVTGSNKGRDLKERIKCSFGSVKPEGYKKYIRAINIADNNRMPVINIVDTPGAYADGEAEARGQFYAIADAINASLNVRVPIFSCITGEGGSGGAVSLAVADRVTIFEHAFYSVIGPEACASILFNNADRREHVANNLKLTSKSLLSLGIVDEIITEPIGGAHRDNQSATIALKKSVITFLSEYCNLGIDYMRTRRNRFLDFS